ncbi:C_GCAxxG_C_C family protein [archaeon]|nr:MAG: C_GCAxxG_C_C family protein [archaeon]
MDHTKAGLEQRWMPTPKADKTLAQASPEKILDAIAAQAFENLDAYGNCCRSTLWAIQTHLRKEEPATLRASSVLAGGICGTGQTCGAVLGGLIAIGEALGSEDFRDVASYESANARAKEFVEWIHETFGSTCCFDIQKAVMGWCHDNPSKDAEWQEAGGPMACAGVCAQASRRAAAIILSAHSTKAADCGGVETEPG